MALGPRGLVSNLLAVFPFSHRLPPPVTKGEDLCSFRPRQYHPPTKFYSKAAALLSYALMLGYSEITGSLSFENPKRSK